MYDLIDNWYEPADELRIQPVFVSEMSRDDHGFLCGIIRKIKPEKVLEIGVAEGGTTSVIENALVKLGNSCEMYSVDLNERLFCNTNYKTGYIKESMEQCMQGDRACVSHKFLLGGSIAKYIEQIGTGIDLAVIDTTHRLPGELLDVLCVLPYMNKNGVIILHDVNLNYYKTFSSDSYEVMIADVRMATKILLATITGKKYLNDNGSMLGNIGAIELTEDTIRNALDIFWMLTGTWDYHVSNEMLEQYKNIFQKFYD